MLYTGFPKAIVLKLLSLQLNTTDKENQKTIIKDNWFAQISKYFLEPINEQDKIREILKISEKESDRLLLKFANHTRRLDIKKCKDSN